MGFNLVSGCFCGCLWLCVGECLYGYGSLNFRVKSPRFQMVPLCIQIMGVFLQKKWSVSGRLFVEVFDYVFRPWVTSMVAVYLLVIRTLSQDP